MSWLFSQALVEEYSAGTSLDGGQCAQLNVMPTQRPFWHRDKMMDVLNRSPFGLTWKPLTAKHGAELLTWYLEGFPARTSASLEKAQASTASDPAYGWKWQGSYAKYDHATYTWKTRQCSLLVDSEKFSETWPRWGLMRDGECLEQQTLAHHTGVTGSGSLPSIPTRTARDHKAPNALPYSERGGGKKGEQLANYVAHKMLPTPTACGGNNVGTLQEWGGSRNPLRGTEISRRRLNVEWVEWLMGWPVGWTELKPLGTDKYQEWRQQHGDC